MAFTQRAAAIWRDYVVPLNPLSGIYKPEKPLIRQWGKEIEDQLAALAAAAGFDPSIVTDLRDGLDAETARGRLLTSLTADRQTRSRLLLGRQRRSPNGDWYSNGGTFQGWAFPFIPQRTSEGVNRLTVWVPDTSTLSRLDVSFYRRALSDLNAGGPGRAGDVLLRTASVPIADIIADTTDPTAQRCDLPVDVGHVDPGYAYIAQVMPFGLSGQPTFMGIARGANLQSQGTAEQQGMVLVGGVWSPISGTQTVAFEVGEKWPGVDADKPRLPVVLPAGPLPRKALNAAGGNWQLVLPEITVEGTTQNFKIRAGTLATFAQPSTLTPPTSTLPIQYNIETWLPHVYLTALSAVRNGTSAPLVIGTDIRVDYDKGTITGLVNTSLYLADVTYTTDLNRNDVLYADRVTGALGVATSAERGADLSEYPATVPSGAIEIARVFVTRSRNIDVMWTCRYRDFVKLADPGPDLAWVSYCKERLPKSLRILQSGQTLTIAPYGDSITEQGGGGTGSSYWYVPNGQYRDQINGGYYQYNRIGADRLAAEPRYSHGDAGDPNHIHTGWAWHLKRELERRYQSTIVIQNMGIGGSTSDNAMTNGVPGGGYPDRINALINLSPNLVILAFGMNDQDPQVLYINVKSIIETLAASGIEVIVMGMPITPPLAHRRTPELAQQMNAGLIGAAMDAMNGRGVAYIPVARYFDADSMDAVGISTRQSNAFGSVHPLMRELGIMGQILAKPFLT